MHKIEPGDTVILVDTQGNKYKVVANDATVKVRSLGVVDLGKLLGMHFGEKVTLAGTEVIAIEPSIMDHLETLERKAQIIIPKDCAYIILHCGIRSGSTVVEGGSGSGALTVALAGAVAPEGKVISYDMREEHQTVARRNIASAGLSSVVTFKLSDMSKSIDEKGVDAVVLDMAEPWTVVPKAAGVLKIGGYIATYTPTANQAERTVNALKDSRFTHIRSVELILREMVVTEGGIRPSFDMLGHTGYVTTARWLGQ